MRPRIEKRNHLRGYAHALWSDAFGRCLSPGGSCANPPIKAHSVQRRGPMGIVSRGGHVVMLHQRLDLEKGPTISFESVGVRKATTFTGLCAAHDAALFKQVDLNPGQLKDEQSRFLHAYRAVLRETHVCLESAVKLQSIYLKKCDLGLADPDVPTRAGLFAAERLAVAYETWLYKEHIDQAFVRGDLGVFSHDLLDLGKTGPCVAVSSLFSLDEVKEAEDTPRVALSVIPVPDGRTYALLSYTHRDLTAARARLEPILTATDRRQHYLLSRLILERSDNIIINPRLYALWGEGRRNAIRRFFEATILENAQDFDDERLNLFDRDPGQGPSRPKEVKEGQKGKRDKLLP
jgi:hypothetical protein